MVCISPFLPYIFASNSKKYDMEIISIEDRTFDRMLKRLGTTARMAEDVHRRFREKKMGEWLDNQEACILLNITPRTLQSLRENGMLAYSQICHKIYYIPEDIQKTLSLLLKRKEEQP